MKTLIINKATGKINFHFIGPISINSTTISNIQNIENYEIIEYSGPSPYKAIENNGVFEVVEDTEKIISIAKNKKIKKIYEYMGLVLGNGFLISGKSKTGSSFIDGIVTFDYKKDRKSIELHSSRAHLIKSVNGTSQSEKLLRGRQSYKIYNFKKDGYVEFNNVNEVLQFVKDFDSKCHEADIISSDKAGEVIVLDTVEDVESYDETAGWEGVS